MYNFKIKYAAAHNFLPFGPEGIELYFEKYKNIVLVRGENRDAKQLDPSLPSDEIKISSNGTGKSSIQEIIVYALYGKTVKRPEKLGANDVVHNKIGKDAKVEIIFDKYRIVRSRKENGKDNKNSLRLWESDSGTWDKTTEITQGTMAATQAKIEDVLGLSYEAFVNICIFTDDQRACFLECENKQKKEIVENMLALGVYRQWFENAKVLRKEIKSKIDVKSKEYNLLLSNKDAAIRRLEVSKSKEKNWIDLKNNEIKSLLEKIEKIEELMKGSDVGAAILAYEEAQQTIKDINENKIPEIEKSKTELKNKLKLATEKEATIKNEAQTAANQYNDISRNLKDLMNQRKTKESEITHIKSHKIGSMCDKCHGTVSEENIYAYADQVQKDIESLSIKIKNLMVDAKKVEEEVAAIKEKQEKIKSFLTQITLKIEDCDKKLADLQTQLVKASQVREPKTDNEQALLQQKIVDCKASIKEKREELKGNSPFKEIIENDVAELEKVTNTVEEKEAEVKVLENDLPYCDYWITGFGDQGIRKWIVDGIVPELNNRINYWLQFLIDNRISLKFDNELNEIIERNPVDGDPYIYHAMSTGQRRRLNLAVSQAFAHIMMLSTGTTPSLMFLDEVTTNVDPLGVQGIYNMICEIAQDRQVFITTHDHDLIRMLDGCEELKLVHENGFTKLT